MNIKQYHIDNGFIGGVTTTVLGSLFILGPINTIILISMKFGDNIMVYLYFGIAFVFWMWFYFAIFVPSQIIFQNRQGTTHKNPIYEKVIILESKLDAIMEELNARKQ